MSRQYKRLEREEKIISATLALLDEKSFLDIRMSEVARASECSMGAVYSHFSSKEDLLLACAAYTSKNVQYLFQKSVSLQRSTIEKLLTLVMVNWFYDGNNPQYYQLRQLAMTPAVWKRASSKRSEQLDQQCHEVSGIVKNVIEELMASELSDQCMGNSESAMRMLMGLWGLNEGMFQIRLSGFGLKQPDLLEDEGVALLVMNMNCFLKGWGWRGELTAELVEVCQENAREILADIQGQLSETLG